MFAKVVEFSKGKRTAVVAVSAGLDPDSSHLITQLIKPFMADNAEIHLYNGISAFQKKLTNYDLCLLIDEFSGTGATITQRFNYVFKDAKGRGHNLDIKVLLISAMEKAIEFIKENGISVSVEKTLRAGLSSYFIEEDLKRKIDIMRLFEQGLAAKFNDADIPSLGYGEAEALYSVQNWNAPNSNFPILWWPYDDKGKKRAVIFRRGAP